MPTMTNRGPQPYSEDDLAAARYAEFVSSEHHIQYSNKTIYQTVWGIESEFLPSVWEVDANGDDVLMDWNNPKHRERFRLEVVDLAWKKYERGVEVLKICKVLYSDRTVVMPNERLRDSLYKDEDIVSPVIVVNAGYIATTPAYRYCALALRKTL